MSQCYSAKNVKVGKIIYHGRNVTEDEYEYWSSCSECGSTNLSFADEECPDCGAVIIGEEYAKE